jgi:hypothetical protein
MLLRGEHTDHTYDDVVTFCESHVLVREVVAGLEECRSDYILGAWTEPKMKEPLGCLVKVADTGQTFVELGLGGS